MGNEIVKAEEPVKAVSGEVLTEDQFQLEIEHKKRLRQAEEGGIKFRHWKHFHDSFVYDSAKEFAENVAKAQKQRDRVHIKIHSVTLNGQPIFNGAGVVKVDDVT